MAAEYQKNIKSFNCVMDQVDKPKFITYDAGKKEVTFHFTREGTMNSHWIGAFMEKDPKMKAAFPNFVKYLKTQNY